MNADTKLVARDILLSAVGEDTEAAGVHGSLLLAASQQVFFGGAVFWHLQKRLLLRYAPVQVVAWYYQYGTAVLLLAVLPHATRRDQLARFLGCLFGRILQLCELHEPREGHRVVARRACLCVPLALALGAGEVIG